MSDGAPVGSAVLLCGVGIIAGCMPLPRADDPSAQYPCRDRHDCIAGYLCVEGMCRRSAGGGVAATDPRAADPAPADVGAGDPGTSDGSGSGDAAGGDPWGSDAGASDAIASDTGTVDEKPCEVDCSGLECGPDPVCGVSCGTCLFGTCFAGSCTACANGTSCEDGDPCTYPDTCNPSGFCVPGAATSCAPAPGPCGAIYVCNGHGGCDPWYWPGGETECDDDELCTYDDHCDGWGGCTGTELDCADDACFQRTCNGSPWCAEVPLSGRECGPGDVRWVCCYNNGSVCNGAQRYDCQDDCTYPTNDPPCLCGIACADACVASNCLCEDSGGNRICGP